MTWIRDLISDGVALANDILDDGGALETVTHKAWTGQTRDGTESYATITREALVIKKQRLVQSAGQMVQSSHTLYFFSPLTDTASSDAVRYPRTNPIDPQDKFILPDGTKGVVVPVEGLYDPLIHRSYYQEVVLR